jgi:cytochrome bd ubiquinol oxidase subunit I
VSADSPSVTSTDIWISLVSFVLIYIALGAADVFLMLRYARRGLDHEEAAESEVGPSVDAAPALTY